MSGDEGRMRRTRAWAAEHPGQAVGAVVLLIAVVRLLVVSHGHLRTAAALLESADLASLATGVLLFSAVLWLPFAVAPLAYMALARAGRVGALVALTLAGLLAGAVLVVADVDLVEIALGGGSFLALAIAIGIGIGAIAVFVRGAGDASPPAGDAEPHVEARQGPEDVREAVARLPRDRPGTVFGWLAFAWVGLLALAFTVVALAVVFLVLSEPSQPAEALTVSTPDGEVTHTVHVLDDAGDEWLVMARSDRDLLSVDAGDVLDRYVCSTINLDPALRVWTRRVLEDGTAADLLGELDALGNEDWRGDLATQPPACLLDLPSGDVDAVRRFAGISCPELLRCDPGS